MVFAAKGGIYTGALGGANLASGHGQPTNKVSPLMGRLRAYFG